MLSQHEKDTLTLANSRLMSGERRTFAQDAKMDQPDDFKVAVWCLLSRMAETGYADRTQPWWAEITYLQRALERHGMCIHRAPAPRFTKPKQTATAQSA